MSFLQELEPCKVGNYNACHSKKSVCLCVCPPSAQSQCPNEPLLWPPNAHPSQSICLEEPSTPCPFHTWEIQYSCFSSATALVYFQCVFQDLCFVFWTIISLGAFDIIQHCSLLLGLWLIKVSGFAPLAFIFWDPWGLHSIYFWYKAFVVQLCTLNES